MLSILEDESESQAVTDASSQPVCKVQVALRNYHRSLWENLETQVLAEGNSSLTNKCLNACSEYKVILLSPGFSLGRN